MAFLVGSRPFGLCSDVGWEIWLFLPASSVLVWLFLVRTRAFQAWLRDRRERDWSLRMFPRFVFMPKHAWVIRLVGLIPLLMWVAAISGVYCFFAGPDVPPVKR